jgi:hypothetical protein
MRRLVVVGAIVLGCAACGANGLLNPFAPIFKNDERFVVRKKPEGAVQLESMHVTRRDVTVTGWGTFDRPRSIQRASFASVDAPPCSLSARTKVFWLGGDRRWDRPVGWSGSQWFELTLTTPRALFSEAAALDLAVREGDRETCLRTRLSGAEPGTSLRREDPFAKGGGFGLTIASGMDEAGTARRQMGIQLGGSTAVWAGLWRGSLRADLRIPLNSGPWWVSLPFTFQGERVVSLGRRFTLGMSLGYQPGRLEDLFSLFEANRTWSHGPRLGLMFLGGRDVADSDPREGFAARGIGLFLMRQWNTATKNEALPRAAWIAGVEAIAL